MTPEAALSDFEAAVLQLIGEAGAALLTVGAAVRTKAIDARTDPDAVQFLHRAFAVIEDATISPAERLAQLQDMLDAPTQGLAQGCAILPFTRGGLH
jgi:hypothetical protein